MPSRLNRIHFSRNSKVATHGMNGMSNYINDVVERGQAHGTRPCLKHMFFRSASGNDLGQQTSIRG